MLFQEDPIYCCTAYTKRQRIDQWTGSRQHQLSPAPSCAPQLTPSPEDGDRKSLKASALVTGPRWGDYVIPRKYAFRGSICNRSSFSLIQSVFWHETFLDHRILSDTPVSGLRSFRFCLSELSVTMFEFIDINHAMLRRASPGNSSYVHSACFPTWTLPGFCCLLPLGSRLSPGQGWQKQSGMEEQLKL